MSREKTSFASSYLKRLRSLSVFRLCLVIALLAATASAVMAQQIPAKSTATNTAGASTATPEQLLNSSPKSAEERYRIGPGDVLDIRVFNKPQFSRDGVRVDGRGMIRMPLIEGEIRAACRSEEDLAQELSERYKEFLRNPQVDVFIKEFQSQPVAVLGAVRAPSRFQLQRRVRLLELLSFVGGPAENAGRSIQVVHTAAPDSLCALPSAPNLSEEAASVDYYSLNETLKGEDQANPFMRAGDVVSIAEADQVFVVGNVLKPSAFALKEPLTVSRAIAMAGGTLPDTKSDRVRIVRQATGSASKTEIYVDLKAIDKHQAEDLVLQANDIVNVPTSSGKRFLRSIVGAVAPTVAQLPVRVVP